MRAGDRLVPAGAAHTVVTADGARLALTVCGPTGGPTVVLAHCWTGAREVWAPVAHRLVAAGHRVALYDQRGHGSSTLGREGCSLDALGDDLAAVLDTLGGPGAGRAVVAGHSMGGMSVQSFLRRRRDAAVERLAGVALVATTAGGLSHGRVLDAVAARAVGSAAVGRCAGGPGGRALVRGSAGRRTSRDVLDTTRELFAACPADVRAGFLRAMQAMDLRGALDPCPVPVRVLAGRLDTLTPLRHATALAATPGAELTVLDGAGHMLPLERPDEVAAAIVALAAPVADRSPARASGG